MGRRSLAQPELGATPRWRLAHKRGDSNLVGLSRDERRLGGGACAALWCVASGSLPPRQPSLRARARPRLCLRLLTVRSFDGAGVSRAAQWDKRSTHTHLACFVVAMRSSMGRGRRRSSFSVWAARIQECSAAPNDVQYLSEKWLALDGRATMKGLGRKHACVARCGTLPSLILYFASDIRCSSCPRVYRRLGPRRNSGESFFAHVSVRLECPPLAARRLVGGAVFGASALGLLTL